MANVNSSVTGLPCSCKAAAEKMASELAKEEAFADLSEDCCQKLTQLEQVLSKETGENVALVAYRM